MIEVELRGPVRIEAEIGELKILPPFFQDEDEGKVVNNGALVSQTAHAIVTQNGVVDTTLNDSVEVAVPGPSGTKDVYVTRNGETTRDIEDYSMVRIHTDVPNSYTSSDEGKVVSNGALVEQTPHAPVTENGVVNTTLNDSVEVAVPGPSGTKTISITANGTTTEDVEDYEDAEISVNVSNTYSASDEGKVVNNGALVSQTRHAPVTSNGTIDTTLYNKVTVAVPASEVDWGTKRITSNGTHDVVGYASANVNVPNSYSASDEGKVVDDGELVSQTPHATVTQNGVVDTTLNDSVEVAVPASEVDSGTKSITTNGTHDVIGYASAQVAVPASAVDSGTKSITSNGTHNVVGYASAQVNVPNSYTSSDEGKVVSNGALIAQVAHALVTANGVIDTTLNNSVEIAVPSGGIEFPSDWFVDSWTQASDSQSKTWTHGLGQQPHFVVCMCLDSDYGSNGRILDMAFAKPDGTWVQSGVASANTGETSAYWSQSIGYNGYTIDDTTITLTQGRYYSATFKQGKKYLLLAHK